MVQPYTPVRPKPRKSAKPDSRGFNVGGFDLFAEEEIPSEEQFQQQLAGEAERGRLSEFRKQYIDKVGSGPLARLLAGARETQRRRIIAVREKNAAEATSRLPALVREPAEYAAPALGADILSTFYRPFSKDLADYFADTGKRFSTAAESKRKDDWSPWLSRMYGNSFRSGLGSLLAAPSGTYGIIGFNALTESNQALRDAELANLTGGDRIKYAVTRGAIEVGITAGFSKIGLGGLESSFGNLRKDGVKILIQGISKSSMKKVGTNFLKSSALELPEEWIIEISNAVAESAYRVDRSSLEPEKLRQRLIDTTAQTLLTVGLFKAGAKGADLAGLNALAETGKVSRRDAAELQLPGDASRTEEGRLEAVRRRIDTLEDLKSGPELNIEEQEGTPLEAILRQGIQNRPQEASESTEATSDTPGVSDSPQDVTGGQIEPNTAESVDYQSMKYSELKKLLKERNIKGRSKAISRKQIIKLLKENDVYSPVSAAAGSPETLLQAVRSLGGISAGKTGRGERNNIQEDFSQSGLLAALQNRKGDPGSLDLEEAARELESAGYWYAPDGVNKGDALLDALKENALTIEGEQQAAANDYAKLEREAIEQQDEGGDTSFNFGASEMADAIEAELAKRTPKRSERKAVEADEKKVVQAVDATIAAVEFGVTKFDQYVSTVIEAIGEKAAMQMAPYLEEAARQSGIEGVTSFADEVAKRSPEETSIKNETTGEIRKRRDLTPTDKPESQTVQEWFQAGRVKLAQDPQLPIRIIREVLDSPRQLNNVEVAVLQDHYRELNNRFEEASNALFDAKDQGLDSVQAQREVDALLEMLNETEEASRLAGSEWGRAGVARQQALAQDFSLAGMMRRARVANAGKALTPEQQSEVKALANRVQELESKLFEVQKQDDTKAQDRIIDAQIKKDRIRKRVVKARKKVDDAWAEFEGVAKDKLYSNPMDLALPTVKLTAAYIELGVTSFAELMTNVRARIGENSSKVEDAFRRAWNDLKSGEEFQEPSLSRDNARSVTNYARKVQRAVVELGVTDRDQVVAIVNDAVGEYISGFTERDTRDALSGYGQFTPLSKNETQRLIRDINGQLRQLSKIEDLEAGKDVAPTGFEQRQPSEEEQSLIDRVNELQKQSGASSRKAYRTRLANQLLEYQRRIQENDFSEPEKRKAVEPTKEELELKKQLQDAKSEFYKKAFQYRLENMSPGELTADRLRELAYLSRAAMTAFDLSAPFRQGGAVTFAHPILAAKASKEMLKALVSEQGEFNSLQRIRNRSNGSMYRPSGLALVEEGASLTNQEEAFMGRWSRLVPGIAASGRAYVTFMNNVRADLFDHMVANLGRSGEVTLDEAKAIASYVNVATGRADLGTFNEMAANLNAAFFAPRFVASRFQYAAMPFYMPFTKNTARVKKEMAKEYGRHMIGVASFLGLSVALGSLLTDDEDEKPTVSFDPRSSDFLKLKIGDRRIDPMSGLSQAIVLGWRIAVGEMKSGDKVIPLRGDGVKFGGPTTVSTIGRFLRTKLAPIPGAAMDATTYDKDTGMVKDVMGNERPLIDWPLKPSLVGNMFTPLAVREVSEAMQSQGVPLGMAQSTLGILGMGIGTYGPKTKYAQSDKDGRERMLKSYLKFMKIDSPEPEFKDQLTQEQLDRVNERREKVESNLVHLATRSPSRAQHKSDETYEASVQSVKNAKDSLAKSGLSHLDAQKALIRHFGGKMTNIYSSKREALGKLYGKTKDDFMEELLGEISVVDTEFDVYRKVLTEIAKAEWDVAKLEKEREDGFKMRDKPDPLPESESLKKARKKLATLRRKRKERVQKMMEELELRNKKR